MSGTLRVATSDTDVKNVLHSQPGRLIVAEFVSRSSPVSSMYADITQDLVNRYSDVTFIRINADWLKRFVEIEAIETFPTFIFWKGCQLGKYVAENEIPSGSTYELEYQNVSASLERLVSMYR